MTTGLPIIPQYALNLERLKPGDIILSRESATFKEILMDVHQLTDVAVSSTVRAFSRGYSHAMLYLDKAIFHAVIPQVYSYNPQRLAIRRESDICVLRCSQLTDAKLKTIDFFARTKIGAEYSIPEAVKVIWRRKSKRGTYSQRQFCSRFVAQAYHAAGLELVSNPDFCAPGDFKKCGLLKKVPDVLRIATEADKEVWRTRDSVSSCGQKLNGWLHFVRTCAKEGGGDLQTIDDVLEFLRVHPWLDDRFANNLIESGYLDEWKQHDTGAAYRYHPVLRQELILSGKDTLLNMCRMEIQFVELHSQNFVGLVAMNQGFDLKTIALFADLQKKLVEDGHNALQSVITLIGGAYPMIGTDDLIKFLLCSEALINDDSQHLDRIKHLKEICNLGTSVLNRIADEEKMRRYPC